MTKYHWYEKLFYHLQLSERKYLRLVFSLTLIIFIIQILLIFPGVRKSLVLTERFEGEPVHILRKF